MSLVCQILGEEQHDRYRVLLLNVGETIRDMLALLFLSVSCKILRECPIAIPMSAAGAGQAEALAMAAMEGF